MNWIKDNLILLLALAIVALGVLLGVQTLRLANAHRDMAKAEAEWQGKVAKASEEARLATENNRKNERRMEAMAQERDDEQATYRKQRDLDRATVRQQLDRLRDAIASAERGGASPAPQPAGEPVSPTTVTGALLEACAREYAGVGEEADRLSDQVRGLHAFIAGLSCSPVVSR